VTPIASRKRLTAPLVLPRSFAQSDTRRGWFGPGVQPVVFASGSVTGFCCCSSAKYSRTVRETLATFVNCSGESASDGSHSLPPGFHPRSGSDPRPKRHHGCKQPPVPCRDSRTGCHFYTRWTRLEFRRRDVRHQSGAGSLRAGCASLSNRRQIVFFGFMFACSLWSVRAKAAVFASVRIGDPPVHLRSATADVSNWSPARPALLNHIGGRDRLRDPKL
jgi:hypothetical protein